MMYDDMCLIALACVMIMIVLTCARCVMLCYVMLCFAISCHVILCHVMPCCGIIFMIR